MIIAGTLWGERLASLSMLDLIWQASWLVQVVMLLLVAASVVSWAAIAFKWRELSGAEQDSEGFLEVYQQGSWDRSHEAARRYERSPLAAVFLTAWSELQRVAKYKGRTSGDGLDEGQVAS